MLSYCAPHPCFQFEQTLAPFLAEEGLPFADVLPAETIERAFAEEGVCFGATKKSVFTPAITLWAFLSQVVHEAKSCHAAVLRVAALLIALKRTPCSEDTAAYCRARAKLPTCVLRRLAVEVSRELERQVPAEWLWHGRHVQLVDGTTDTLPDTQENQEVYPQQRTQKPGLGFPIIRMVVLLSLATAALLDMAFGPYCGKETGETALLRQLLGAVPAGDVLLADRYYCSYWMVALAQGRGVDVVFRLHQLRAYDFRRGKRLGRDDHIVSWRKPQRPDWMDEATYVALPEHLTVREIRYQVRTPGFRVDELVIATTLTDATLYTQEDLADLYHERWHAELDIRAIKISMKMDPLRCKTPFMVEKEIWAHFLGYNLVRKVSAQTALARGLHPRAVSFTGTKDALAAAWGQLTLATAAERFRQGRALLEILGTKPVGNRPDRTEPRQVKRRPKQYKHLRKPRAEAQAELRKKPA
jgi:putative transposase